MKRKAELLLSSRSKWGKPAAVDEKIKHLLDEEDAVEPEVGEGAEGEDDEQREEEEEVDYDYEDDEIEMGGDYGAEQYFDGGDGDDEDGGDGGGGGDDY